MEQNQVQMIKQMRMQHLEVGLSKESVRKGIKVQERKIMTVLMDRVIVYVHQMVLL